MNEVGFTNGQFGQDYNLLRSLTLEALPQLDPRLIGKEIEIRRSAEGVEVCTTSYVEIETFARQIMEHSDDNPRYPVAAEEARALEVTLGPEAAAVVCVAIPIRANNQ